MKIKFLLSSIRWSFFFLFTTYQCLCTNVFGQVSPANFVIVLPEQIVKNSAYKNIDFSDSRNDGEKDRSNYGIIKIGGWNKPVTISIPLQNQLKEIIKTLTDSSAKHRELLFQLRKFYFGSLSRTWTDRGYYYFKATLYSKNNNGSYQRLDSLDTAVIVKSSNLNTALFKSAGKMVSNFISKNLTNGSPDTVSYTFTDIMYIDEIEKKRLPLYTTKNFKEGLYLTYKSFAKQVPDQQVKVEMKNDKVKSVIGKGDEGEEENLNSKNVYALVYQGQPYIATNAGFFPLRKTQSDFLFTGKFKTETPSVNPGILFGVIGGVMGALLMPRAEAEYEMKIDHVKGEFITIREVLSH